MKTAFFLFFILLLYSTIARSQQTFNSLNVKDLALPSESISSALYINGSGKVKSSPSVSGAELEYIGTLGSNAQTQIDGKVSGQVSSIDAEIALFDSTSGKIIKRATGSGFVKATSGVYGTSSQVNMASEITGVAPVANGGTGLGTLTANSLLVGNGTSNLTFVAPSTSGNFLRSNGTSWASVAFAAMESSGSVSGNIQMVTFGSGAGAIAPCTTGTCTLGTQRLGSLISSITFSSTGSYQVNGLDYAKWSCVGSGWSSVTGQYYVLWTHIANGTGSYVSVQTGILTAPANAGGVTVFCLVEN